MLEIGILGCGTFITHGTFIRELRVALKYYMLLLSMSPNYVFSTNLLQKRDGSQRSPSRSPAGDEAAKSPSQKSPASSRGDKSPTAGDASQRPPSSTYALSIPYLLFEMIYFSIKNTNCDCGFLSCFFKPVRRNTFFRVELPSWLS